MRRDIHRRELRPAVENVSTEARRDLRVGEQLHEAEKRYLAVVEGSPPADHGVLRSHLDESGPFKVYSAPPSERTRHAATYYLLMKRIATRALIELTPETGRRNQIRVHLADAECTIIGDRKYAARTNPARRLGLQQHQPRAWPRAEPNQPMSQCRSVAMQFSESTSAIRILPRHIATTRCCYCNGVRLPSGDIAQPIRDVDASGVADGRSVRASSRHLPIVR